MSDNVNHPSHYTDGKYETIEFIERNLFDYHDGNAIKYISRAGKKDPDKMIEDLEKALWYINRADHKLNYNEHAITVHDYILDKKLSPALASVISLIEVSQYEEAYKMLKAEIERLKNEEKKRKIENAIDVNTSVSADAVDALRNGFMKLNLKDHEFYKIPYFGKVVCVNTRNDIMFSVGKVYEVLGAKVTANNNKYINFSVPFYSFADFNSSLAIHSYADFIEFKGEA